MVNLELMSFIERNILPRYSKLDAAHNMEHVMHVIKASIDLANKLGADVDMCYVIAAYHDLGLEKDRAQHHIISGNILKGDKRLEKWFSPQQIEIMRQAVEDHRASASRAPRNIYGKIVAEADRDLDPDRILTRTVLYGLHNYPELSDEQQWQRFCDHMMQKYSTTGYIQLWIPGSQNEKNLALLRNIIADKNELRRRFMQIYANVKS